MAIELTEQLLTQIDGYLKDTLSIVEKEAFEKRLRSEPELQEEVRLQQQLFDILGNEEWHTIQRPEHKERLTALKSKLRSKEYQDLSASIRNAEQAYLTDEVKVHPLKKYYRHVAFAASIIVFFGIYFTQMNASSYRSLYEDHVNWSQELPSFVEKGQQKDIFLQGETAFKQKNYKEASVFFEKVTPSHELYNYSLQYLGAAFDKLDENDKAIAAFQKLASVNDPHERSKGNWYTAMIYLKMEQKDKAIAELQKLVKDTDSYKYTAAKALLDKLE
ncbi:tetratricopeptide repeat protein [uncultured Kordia sp.]|uniref:tetratricopeptide repeat protein n=1 Tax=uncultured Kordia sp. TaxID=507699 RepID=UPI0026075076|nr:tetratricopeptide repeat protein [uncultured Kordia sp.]